MGSHLIPLDRLPGFPAWGRDLDRLVARPEALWIFGPPGSGVSALADQVARLRGTGISEGSHPPSPGAVVAADRPCPWPGTALELRLPALEECPGEIPRLVDLMAEQEGVDEPPASLGRLPCPGNLRELRNRVVRYRLTGQLPELNPLGPPDFTEEHLGLNLHRLEAYLLHRALRRSYGNRQEAARRLGVSRPQLYALIRRHGDPVRGEAPTEEGPKRVTRRKGPES